MSNITFAQLSAAIRETVFPEGEAENLVANHTKYLTDGLIELQKIIPCFQDNHVEYIEQCSTYYNCGATVLNAPTGKLLSISTLTDDDSCDRVYYTLTTKQDIDCRIRALVNCGAVPHSPSSYYDQGYGFYVSYAELAIKGMEYPSCDTDHSCRASAGVFTRWRDQIWMFPNINCNELVVLEWDGVKIDWQATDEIEDNRELKSALELYLGFMAALREDCDRDKYVALKAEYEAKRAFLVWSCQQGRKVEAREACEPCESPSFSGSSCSSGNSTSVAATLASLQAQILTLQNQNGGLLFGNGSPEGVRVGNQGWIYTDLLTGDVYKFVGTNGSTSGWV